MENERPATFRYLEEAARTTPGFEDVDAREVERILSFATLETVGQEIVDSFGIELSFGFATNVGGIASKDAEMGIDKVAKSASKWSQRTVERLGEGGFDTSCKIPPKNQKSNKHLRSNGQY